MRRTLLCLEGQKIERDGKTFVGISTSLHEHPNGHHNEERPLSGSVYEASVSPGTNGRNGKGNEPINVNGDTKISSLAS